MLQSFCLSSKGARKILLASPLPIHDCLTWFLFLFFSFLWGIACWMLDSGLAMLVLIMVLSIWLVSHTHVLRVKLTARLEASKKIIPRSRKMWGRRGCCFCFFSQDNFHLFFVLLCFGFAFSSFLCSMGHGPDVHLSIVHLTSSLEFEWLKLWHFVSFLVLFCFVVWGRRGSEESRAICGCIRVGTDVLANSLDKDLLYILKKLLWFEQYGHLFFKIKWCLREKKKTKTSIAPDSFGLYY